MARAVELTERKDGNILDTLASVLAEVGRHEEAVQTQREALAQLDPEDHPQANEPAFRKAFEDRLKQYEAALAKTHARRSKAKSNAK